jgi:hypothetical protein
MKSSKLVYKTLVQLRQAGPFEPSTVMTQDGQRYPVAKWRHVGTNGTLLFITNEDDLES